MLSKTISNAAKIVGGLAVGELPSKDRLLQLLEDGMTVAEIAALVGISESVIRSLLDE